MENVFETIKRKVSAEDAAEALGLETKHRKAICPFHADHNPSLTFYDGVYHCFGCQAHGDAIDFVSRYLTIRPIEAARWISERFGLGLFVGKAPSAYDEDERQKTRDKEMQDRRAARLAELQFKTWREMMIEAMDVVCETAVAAMHDTTYPDLEWDNFTAACVKFEEWAEYIREILVNGEDWEQRALFANRDREVDRTCSRILGTLASDESNRKKAQRKDSER